MAMIDSVTLENMTTRAIGLLEKMISIPSRSREEKDVADMIERHMSSLGLDVSRLGNNLWCMAEYDATRPTLLLDAHIDTVRKVDGWTKDAFVPTLEGDRIYGLGSNDDGASVVSLLEAFLYLCKRRQKYNLIFSASAEEEVSGKNGFESILEKLPPISVAIAGEPTGMDIAVAEKGLMVLDVTAHGKAGHAARSEGVNAIYEAMDDIQWFRSKVFEKKTDLLGPVKMSVTVINAGTQHNVIPDTCQFTVDVRSNECYINEELYEIICSSVKSEVKARSFRLNSSSMPADHPLLRRGIELGRKTFGSPTLSNQALMKFPSMKMGPGDSSRSHTADEYIRTGEIREAIELYIELLDQLDINW